MKPVFFIFSVFIGLLLVSYTDASDEELRTSQDSFYYYNQGTEHLLSEKYILAYSFLKKAHLLSPFDSNIAHNLSLAAKNTPNRAALDEVGLLFNRVVFFPYFSYVVLLFAGLNIIYAIYWLFLLFRSRPILAHSIGFLTITLLFCLKLLSFEFYSWRNYAITLEATPALSEPKKESTQLLVLETGKTVRIIDLDGEWAQVIYSGSGHRAWIKSARLLLLNTK